MVVLLLTSANLTTLDHATAVSLVASPSPSGFTGQSTARMHANSVKHTCGAAAATQNALHHPESGAYIIGFRQGKVRYACALTQGEARMCSCHSNTIPYITAIPVAATQACLALRTEGGGRPAQWECRGSLFTPLREWRGARRLRALLSELGGFAFWRASCGCMAGGKNQ